jgi:hypothetical protein
MTGLVDVIHDGEIAARAPADDSLTYDWSCRRNASEIWECLGARYRILAPF